MRPAARHDRILDTLTRQGHVTVAFLAETLAASRETIRRDLAELAGQGRLRKTHGGAEALGPGAPMLEGAFEARMQENVPAKRAIARAAAALFRPGDSLFVDTGSTTIYFAEALADIPGLTVITNSLLIARSMGGGQAGSRVLLIGGEFRASSSASLGPLAAAQVHQLKAAHVVLTVGALDVDGIADFDQQEAELARAMLAQGRRLTVLADASKLGRTAIFPVCDLARLDRVVMDAPPPPALAASLRAAGVETVLASTVVEGRKPARQGSSFSFRKKKDFLPGLLIAGTF